MIDGKKVLAVIPARGGSKGLPGKNIMPLKGKPLIGWTLLSARESRYVDRIILSSDDPDIIQTARRLDCEVPFERPPDLADDLASGFDVLIHALDNLEEHYDYAVYLQPTSPLRAAVDIDACLLKCHQQNVSTCVSISATDKPPEWLFYLRPDDGLSPYIEERPDKLQRQRFDQLYLPNGAVYAVHTGRFRQTGKFINSDTVGYLMPKERSIDIDDLVDVRLAECLLDMHTTTNSTDTAL